MRLGASRRNVLLLLLAPCAGCVTRYEGTFNPALFPREALAATAPDTRVPGRVALLTPPSVQGQVYESALGVRLSLGSIAEEALAAAVGDAVRGGVQRVDSVPAASASFAATLVVDAVRAEHIDKLVLPLLFGFSIREQFSQLWFDLILLDAEGRSVWTRRYDGGRELLKLPLTGNPIGSPIPAALTRMAHETAWRLSQQAASDLREWLVAERNKPRDL